jgi:hypothetical protein
MTLTPQHTSFCISYHSNRSCCSGNHSSIQSNISLGHPAAAARGAAYSHHDSGAVVAPP